MSTPTQDVLATSFENRPTMLEKCSYDTWQSRMLMYIEGKENGQMYLHSIEKGPYHYKEIIEPANPEAGQPEKKRTQKLDRVNELMDGIELTKQERETKLADEFDSSSLLFMLVSTFSLAAAKMFEIRVSDSELTRRVGRLKVFSGSSRESYAPQQPLAPQQPYEAPTIQPQSIVTPTSPNSELAIPPFLQIDDPIASFNKAMTFLDKTQNYTRNNAVAGKVGENTWNVRVAGTDVIKNVGDYMGANAVKFKDKMLLAQKEEAGDCNEDLTTRAIFMAKLTPARLVTDNDVGPSYDIDAMSESEEKNQDLDDGVTLGWLLEEIYVTWAHLEKKRTRLRLYTKSLKDYAYSAWRQRHISL
ncbi:hypothetical protein Tco_1293748 [Tanacetum coccineum]